MGWVGELLRGDFKGFLKPVLRIRAEQNDVGKSQIFAQPVEMLAGPAVCFEIGGEIGGFFAQRALGQFGFDFVAQLEKTAGAYKNLENLENMYKNCDQIYKLPHSDVLDLPWSCPHLAGLLCTAADHMLRPHVPTRQLVQLGLRKLARQVLQRAIGGEAALARLSMWVQLHVRM